MLRQLFSSFHFLSQDMSLKCNEEGKSLSTETFAKVSLTNLRRQAVPDLASDLGMNIFKKVRNRRPDANVLILSLQFPAT